MTRASAAYDLTRPVARALAREGSTPEFVQQLAVFYEPTSARRHKVGRLALRDRRLYFEYDPAFLATRLQLSPLKLPLGAGLVTGDPALFGGLPGVFEDSLPDGWGRLLIDRRAAELGMSSARLTPLDRLALVGARGLGALVYEPELPLEDPRLVELAALAQDAERVQQGSRGADLEQLIAVGGSPQGARPKVLVQLSPRGEVLLGARELAPGHSAWMVKFPARGDEPHSAALEHAYFLMAAEAGLEVPRTQLLGQTARRPGYFAIERFDRRGPARVHAHTLGGLLHLPHGYPALDYGALLEVTQALTRNHAAVREQFRRACFNVLAHNRDDHCRNFAFLMGEDGQWAPSPAYDLTFSPGPGGEHTLLVAGEGKAPGRAHLLELARRARIKKPAEILDQVRRAVTRFASFADQARVPARPRNRIAAALARCVARADG